MQLRAIKGTGWLRFSHYDQVIEAARNGSGIAVGKWPHLAEHVREGVLLAPLGASGVATVGAFYLEVAESAPKEASEAFVDWLRQETRRDNEVQHQRRVSRSRVGTRGATRIAG